MSTNAISFLIYTLQQSLDQKIHLITSTKTKYVEFSSWQTRKNNDLGLAVKIDEDKIEQVDCITFLGLHNK